MDLKAVDVAIFKHSMRRFASSVCVVATGGAHPCGMTATSVCSLSAAPPSVLVALNNGSKTAEAIIANGSFSLNLLSSGQDCLAKLFSSDGLRQSKTLYLTRKAVAGITGAPLIRAACTTMECCIEDVMNFGSHSIFVGRVVSTSARDNSGPLLYHNGSYGSFSEAEPVAASSTQTLQLPCKVGA